MKKLILSFVFVFSTLSAFAAEAPMNVKVMSRNDYIRFHVMVKRAMEGRVSPNQMVNRKRRYWQKSLTVSSRVYNYPSYSGESARVDVRGDLKPGQSPRTRKTPTLVVVRATFTKRNAAGKTETDKLKVSFDKKGYIQKFGFKAFLNKELEASKSFTAAEIAAKKAIRMTVTKWTHIMLDFVKKGYRHSITI